MIFVLGATGMLGKQVKGEAERRRLPVHFDVRVEVVGLYMRDGDVVINCAGVTPDRSDKGTYEMVQSNALLPHDLAVDAGKRGARVIHVSTDCVYSGVPVPRMPGRRYNAVLDRPDPIDLYGRSKLAGEVQAPHVVNVRTSFVGPEHGLMAWLMAHKGETVDGWANAWWTGSTVGAVARALVDMAVSEGPLPNVVHLATAEKLSKAEVLRILSDHYQLGVKVREAHVPCIDRALEAGWILMGLRAALGYEAADD